MSCSDWAGYLWKNVFFCFLFLQIGFCNFLTFIQTSGQFGINYAFKNFQYDKDGDKVQDMNVKLGGQ